MKTITNYIKNYSYIHTISEKLRINKNTQVDELDDNQMTIDNLITHISEIGKFEISDGRKQVISSLMSKRLIKSINNYIFILDDDNLPSELYNQLLEYGKYLCRAKNSRAFNYMLFVNDEIAINIEYNSLYKVQTLLIIYRKQNIFEIYNIINKADVISKK